MLVSGLIELADITARNQFRTRRELQKLKKILTYGTFDKLHYGHIRLLERAKALGDYLIVGVTSDDFDLTRGKINNSQTLMERIMGVRNTGLADEIIVEEYEGQKIDDIRKYHVDVFTVGSDWSGKFDYLREFCQVIYLPRTEGISSTQLRTKQQRIRLSLIGDSDIVTKYYHECRYVNGLEVMEICSTNPDRTNKYREEGIQIAEDYTTMLEHADAVYLYSHPSEHYRQIRQALEMKKHVLCESPIAENEQQCRELFELAEKKGCVLMDAIKTAYSVAYCRMLLLLKSGLIGNVVSVDATCTSLINMDMLKTADGGKTWNSMTAWGPTAMLPIFQILGTAYSDKRIVSAFSDSTKTFDQFTKIQFLYDHAIATATVGCGVKSEGQMLIAGTKGYILVPAPWWKTDYFEVRFENQNNNRRYFYALDGEGIRYTLLAFMAAINDNVPVNNISQSVTMEICHMMAEFRQKSDLTEIIV